MTQQGPAMQPEQKSGVPGWLMGCAIGCGILVVAGIVVVLLLGGLGYFAAKKVMEEGKDEVIAELNKEYDSYVTDDVIPEEHKPLFDELHTLGTDKSSSFPAILLCLVAIEAALEDGEVTEEEVRVATDVRDFVKENPQVGFFGMGTFIVEHPELQQAFNEAQTQFGVPSEPGASDAATEEVPEPEVPPAQPAGAEQ
ncbi:MAG: hypothetical protein U9Q79_11100 [Candidatus Hydrogenedentes bacterium]|nr:hypothetical protein [Candidatus Hydrogenedentota bacterium]